MIKQIVIYPKQIELITGKSERSARELVRTIKDAYGKEKHQFLTIREFCEYLDFPYEEVFFMINKSFPPSEFIKKDCA